MCVLQYTPCPVDGDLADAREILENTCEELRSSAIIYLVRLRDIVTESGALDSETSVFNICRH